MTAPRTPSYDLLKAALDAQWDLLADALDAADPSAPTACDGWTVADLARHCAATTAALVRTLGAPEPAGPAADLSRWASALPSVAAAVDDEARTGQPPGFRDAVREAREVLATASPERLVQQRSGAYRLSDAVLIRLVEAVVHGLDLPEPLPPHRDAAKVVVRRLADLLAERAPGRTVELRVPPYAAVQCVEGPRHTRGTPPNVVETDPQTFLGLAGGRVGWQDAVADGRLRVSGERAGAVRDLLPLLG